MQADRESGADLVKALIAEANDMKSESRPTIGEINSNSNQRIVVTATAITKTIPDPNDPRTLHYFYADGMRQTVTNLMP